MRVIALLALAALAIRAGLALLRPADVLDRLFVPDDTYYTLSIARSFARGLGPTIYGTHTTSGFQPLIAFLLVPVLRCCDRDPTVAFRAALVIGAVADAATVWLLGRITWRLASRSLAAQAGRAAIVAAGAWALSTSAIATSLNGLESSLAITCVLGALLAWMRASEKTESVAWAPVGTMLGLCLLARVDTVFFVAIAGLFMLRRAGVRAIAVAVVTALVVVMPWWLYSFTTFGSIIPESGAAVREQTMMYKEQGIVVRDQVAWATGAVVGPPLFDWTWLREALGSGASGVGFAIGILLVAGALLLARRRATHDALKILAINASCIFLFYALYLPATWFFRRYLVPVHVFTTIALTLGYAHLLEHHPKRARLVNGALAACMLVALVRVVDFATATPTMSADHGHHGAKGYADPAKHVLSMAPRGAVIGSFQSGALGWFATGSERDVENLDGVVDGAAARAVRERRIAAHARAVGVTHLADWEVNVKLFLDRSGDPRITRSSLHPVGQTERQGDGEVFVLYAIEWPKD